MYQIKVFVLVLNVYMLFVKNQSSDFFQVKLMQKHYSKTKDKQQGSRKDIVCILNLMTFAE